ncbi:MAG: SPASM domain-containing protein [Victivallaceae bacterium]
MSNDCMQYFLVENNGDVYPCDFFMDAKWKLGNLMTGNWPDFLASPLYHKFGARKRQRAKTCAHCRWLSMCAGCCPKNRPGRGDRPGELSALCDGWKMFFEHTHDRFQQLAENISRERNKAEK